MKFRCERDSLVEVLTTAGRAVSSRTSTADGPRRASGSRSAGNHLSVVGTDLDLTVHVSTEAIGIADGVCVAPAKLLADIVRSLEPGAVTIESEGEKVEIGAARSRFSLRTFPVDDFPSLPEPPQPATFLPASASGRRAAPGGPGRVQRRRPTAADRRADRRRRGAESAWWPPTPTGWPCGTSTGAMRWPTASQILVPARALAELQRLSALGGERQGDRDDIRRGTEETKPGSEPTVGLSIGDHDVTFTAGEVKVSTRLLDGTYPDYRQLIPAEYPNRLHVGKDSLLDALRRVRLLVRDNTTPGPPVDAPRRRRPDRGLPGGG